MEVVERPNAHGQQRVRFLDMGRPAYDYWPDYRNDHVPMGREMATLTVEQAEALAPRLMEWLIKRKRSNE